MICSLYETVLICNRSFHSSLPKEKTHTDARTSILGVKIKSLIIRVVSFALIKITNCPS